MTEREFLFEMGSRLRWYRSAKGMSQTELGRLVGKHRNTVQAIESGQGAPSAWFVERCAVVLQVPLRALVPKLAPKVPEVKE